MAGFERRMPEFLMGENQMDRRLFLQCGASTLAVRAYLPPVACNDNAVHCQRRWLSPGHRGRRSGGIHVQQVRH